MSISTVDPNTKMRERTISKSSTSSAPYPLSLSAASIYSASTTSSTMSRPHPDIWHKSRRRPGVYKCAFCDTALTGALPGDHSVLSCGDLCHRDCLSIVFDRDYLDHLPVCGQCGEKTKCAEDVTAHSSFVGETFYEKPLPAPPVEPYEAHAKLHALSKLQSQLLPPQHAAQFLTEYPGSILPPKPHMSPNGQPVTPESQIIPDTSSDPLLPEIITIGNHKIEVDPSSSHVHNSAVCRNILKPRITCLKHHSAVSVSNDSAVHELNYVLNIKSPEISSHTQKSEDLARLAEIKGQIITFLTAEIQDWALFFADVNVLGDLLAFDNLYVTTNGLDWDSVCCYLFENIILLIHGCKIVGQVMIHDDIRGCKSAPGGTILLMLSNETVPELQLRHDNPIVISKWQTLLEKLGSELSIAAANLYQLSSNAWMLFKEVIDIPQDVLEYSNLISLNSDIPSDLLAESSNKPEQLPLNLIVSVPLINSSNMTDIEYKENITSMLKSIRATLRPIDKLGLIFVGTDARRNPSRSGAFIGCVEANWDGWDRVIEDLKISPNLRRSHTLIHTDLQELTISIEKCMDLFPFIPNSPNNINKFLILNCNNFKNSFPSGGLQKSQELLSRMVNSLVDRVSISLVRIGEEYNDAIKYVHGLICNPNFQDSHLGYAQHPKFGYGTSLLRFDTFREFNSELNSLITDRFQSICVPSLKINIAKDVSTHTMVKFENIEVDGELVAIDELDHFCLLLKDFVPSSERNIIIKAKLELPSEKLNNMFVVGDCPIMNYNYEWFGESPSPYNGCSISTKLTTSPTHSAINTLASPMTPTEDCEERDSYLTSFSPTHQGIIRREVEFKLIQLLKADQNASASLDDVITRCLTLVNESIRSISPNEVVDLKALSSLRTLNRSNNLRLEAQARSIVTNNVHYFQYLVSQLSVIGASVQSNPKLAAAQCEDLAFSLK